jgi:L-arabinose isomerase
METIARHEYSLHRMDFKVLWSPSYRESSQFRLTIAYFRDFAKMASHIELVTIDAKTEIKQFEKELKWNEIGV